MFALSFAKDLIAEVNSINKCMRTGKSETKILRRFVKSIALHADMKQLSVRVHCSQKAHLNFEHFTCRLIKYFSEIYETTVAVVFFGSIVTICTALSFLQLELVQCLNVFFSRKFVLIKKCMTFQITDDVDTLELFEAAVYGCCAFTEIVFTSEIGQIFGDKFEEIDEKINELDWYRLPMEIQRMLPTAMINMQQSTLITCFGTLSCSRETMKMVRPLSMELKQ